MASYNSVTLVGNMGGDPVVRQVGDNMVAEFSLATSQGRRGDNETTDWHRIVAWSPRAEIIQQYAGKGSRLLVRGSIRYRKYTDKEGVERQITEIVAQEVVLLGDNRDASQRQAYVPSGMPAQRAQSYVPVAPGDTAEARVRARVQAAAATSAARQYAPVPTPGSQVPRRAAAEQDHAPLFDEAGNLTPEYDDMPDFTR